MPAILRVVRLDLPNRAVRGAPPSPGEYSSMKAKSIPLDRIRLKFDSFQWVAAKSSRRWSPPQSVFLGTGMESRLFRTRRGLIGVDYSS